MQNNTESRNPLTQIGAAHPPESWVKRKSGSCRFSPYFKLEWFDASLCVWRPLQKTFATVELAESAKDSGRKWRVFEVSETGRRLLH